MVGFGIIADDETLYISEYSEPWERLLCDIESYIRIKSNENITQDISKIKYINYEEIICPYGYLKIFGLDNDSESFGKKYNKDLIEWEFKKRFIFSNEQLNNEYYFLDCSEYVKDDDVTLMLLINHYLKTFEIYSLTSGNVQLPNTIGKFKKKYEYMYKEIRDYSCHKDVVDNIRKIVLNKLD